VCVCVCVCVCETRLAASALKEQLDPKIFFQNPNDYICFSSILYEDWRYSLWTLKQRVSGLRHLKILLQLFLLHNKLPLSGTEPPFSYAHQSCESVSSDSAEKGHLFLPQVPITSYLEKDPTLCCWNYLEVFLLNMSGS
jgi:hypothetical protein